MSSLPNDPNQIKELVNFYIQKGLSIIPVRSDKSPIIPSWKPYQSKKPTEEEFFDLIRKNSREGNVFSGIALITGKISGITVIDLDTGSQDTLWGIKTPTVKTGSGGRHYYFKYTEKLLQGANSTLKIDIRNDGGYAIMPPSVTTKGIYEWIRSLRDTPLADVPEEFIASYSKNTPKVKFSFEGVAEGGRNQQAVVNAGKFIQQFRSNPQFAYHSLVAWNNTNQPPLDEAEIKTIFDWCLNKDLANHTQVSLSTVSQTIDLSQLSDEEFFNVKEREMLTTGINAIDKNFKFPSGYYVICANPGVGKGWYALWLTRKFYQRHQKKSVYFSLEMPENLIRQRIIQAWSDLTENEVAYYRETKNYSPMKKSRELINEKIILIDEFGGSDTSFINVENFKKLFTKYYEEGYRVFHFDHLHEIPGANVNETNQKVTEDWSKMFQSLSKDYPDAWLFIYAQPNGSASSKKILKREDVAGSKAITQKCEFFISLNREVIIDDKTGITDVKNDTREVLMFLGKNRITSKSGVIFPIYFSLTGNFEDISIKQHNVGMYQRN